MSNHTPDVYKKAVSLHQKKREPKKVLLDDMILSSNRRAFHFIVKSSKAILIFDCL